MSVFFFVYTLVIMFACAAAAILSITTWAITRKHGCVAQAGFFLFYVFDLADIFRNEWIAQNTAFDINTYYAVEDPVLRIVFAGLLFGCLWIMLLDVIEAEGVVLRIVPIALFIAASAAVVFLCPYGKWTQWLFYSLRQLFMACALGFSAWTVSHMQPGPARDELMSMRGRFIVLCLLVLAIFVEDSYVILALDPTSTGAFLPLYLSERNFSENVFMVYLSWIVCRSSLHELRLSQ